MDPTGPGRPVNPTGDFGASLYVDPGTTNSITITDPRTPNAHIPDGNYHVWWSCTPQTPNGLQWGTPPVAPTGTATPIPITVPTKTPNCIGSVCLPF